MKVELTPAEVSLMLGMIEKTPALGLEAMRTLVLLACKLQDLKEDKDDE